MQAQMKTVAAALLGAGIAIVGTAGAWSPSSWFGKTESTPPASTPPATEPVVAAPNGSPPATAPTAPNWQPGQTPNYRAIVQTYGPAVVGVTVAGTHKVGNQDDDEQADAGQGVPMNPNDPFFRFFRGLPGFGGPGMPSQNVPFRGQGSGFVLTSDGIVLTNAHVVRDAKEVTVKLGDRREFKAKVLGADADTDIAVLRIDAKGLPTVKLGDPRSLQVGDYVLAIGAPFGFEQSATQGIVSAKGRSLPGDSYVPFIQTDAAVNPGNSGGPMITTEGEVVGVNTAIISGAQAISFSVDINTAKEVASQLIKNGKVFKAWLGFMLQEININPKIIRHYHLQNTKGLFVTHIDPDSPAGRSQIKEGDIIIAFNKKPVNSLHDLFKELTKKDILTLVDIDVVRHTEMLSFGIFPLVKS